MLTHAQTTFLKELLTHIVFRPITNIEQRSLLSPSVFLDAGFYIARGMEMAEKVPQFYILMENARYLANLLQRFHEGQLENTINLFEGEMVEDQVDTLLPLMHDDENKAFRLNAGMLFAAICHLHGKILSIQAKKQNDAALWSKAQEAFSEGFTLSNDCLRDHLSTLIVCKVLQSALLFIPETPEKSTLAEALAIEARTYWKAHIP